MITPLTDKHIILGVTGSIACYKAASLASRLTQAGAKVDVILTRAATAFVSPITFQSVTGRPCFTDEDLWGAQAHVLHVGLARRVDLMVIAPATANTIAKLAHGQSDDLLGLTALSMGIGPTSPPLLIAPAMDGDMWLHPATQENVRRLESFGATIIGPAEGRLASGMMAIGRMTEPEILAGMIRRLLTRHGPLAGRRVVITAGGTQEPIDPVRMLTNRSSGKQGVALVQAALDAGADVTLIAPQLLIPIPAGIERVAAETAEEMQAAVLETCRTADVLLMVAAVADFRPVISAQQKLKKDQGVPAIELERNPDILDAVQRQKSESGRPELVVGFAAETERLLENAREKMQRKKLDMIVANDVSASDSGFSVDTNRVTLLDARGGREPLPLLTKEEVATRVVARIVELLDPAGERADEPLS
jgi:phosphopantothenoylcysteine decarboxylase/phosphopantothenate--cysteine ligase